MPVEMDIASEYRYRNPVVGPGDLVIGITQSGETADTLAAMRLARERGATVLAVTNVMGSQATRDADGVLYTRAGLEVVGRRDEDVRLPGRGHVPARAAAGRAARHARAGAAARAGRRAQAPAARRSTSSSRPSTSSEIAAEPPRDADFFLYLGRHVGLPVALEGALKLKEISYIATDAYAGRRDEARPDRAARRATPVVGVATDSPVLDKVVSNMQEVRARGAHVIAVATEGNETIGEHAEEVIRVPAHRLDAAAAAGRHPAAAAGLPDRAPARAERRPAAQPGQDRHRRVAAGWASGSTCWRSSGWSGRWRAAPGSRCGCSPTRERAYARRGAARPAPRGALLRQGGGRQGAGARGVELAGHRGRLRGRRRRASCCTARWPGRGRGRGVADAHPRDRRPGRGGGVRLMPAAAGWSRCRTPRQMRATDAGRSRSAAIPSLELMERAGEGLAAASSQEIAADGPVAVVVRQRQQRRRRLRRRAAAARPPGATSACFARRRPDGARATRRATSSACPASTPSALAGRRARGRRGHRRRHPRHRLLRRAARRRSRRRSTRSTPSGSGRRRRRPQRRRRLHRRGGRARRSAPTATATFASPSPGCGSSPARRTPGTSWWSTSGSRGARRSQPRIGLIGDWWLAALPRRGGARRSSARATCWSPAARAG